jgi:hypothetical protein
VSRVRPNVRLQPRRRTITPAADGCKPCWAAYFSCPSSRVSNSSSLRILLYNKQRCPLTECPSSHLSS